MSNKSDIFFYSQPEVLRKPGKRAKKVLSENSIRNLNKKIGDRYQSDLLNPNGSDQSLAARLAELTAHASANSMNSSNNISRNNYRGTIYTDTRLQALKFLTEDMIRELEEKLEFCLENEIKPNLPGQIIYDLHSDWSDLTDNCKYGNFPVWQTKNGRESISKKTSEKGDKKDEVQGNRSESVAELRKESQSQLSQRKHSNNNTNNNNNNSTTKLSRTNSKLTSINEKSNNSESRSSRNQHTQRRSSSTAKNTSPLGAQKSRVEVVSRLTHNASVSTGCLLNYQLSSRVFREKGWTVLKIDLDEELLDNERRILSCLKTSLRNIDDVRTYNNRNGLIKPCKIRFYGDHKKEQIEKYKTTIIRPKKSHFAMSISRNEIPKLLDLQYMLDIISNPNLLSITLTNPVTNSKTSLNPKLLKQLTSIQLPRPPCLLNSQTNDGTTCVYYKNGQLAIVIANVYGYFIENGGGGSNSDSRGTIQNVQSSINSSFNSGSNSVNNPILLSQNVKNSNTTVIYDLYKKPPKSASSIANSTRLTTISSTDDYDDKPKSKRDESKLLAIITPLGYCVVYRRNGNPRFVCTEYGGCLCSKNGAVVYQWKWDDLRYTDYEMFKNELFVDLNEFIRLEYKNPNNIKLKFNCDKEIMDFDLASPRENNNKLHDLLNRTVSEFPMKSKIGQLKVIPNAKPQQILTYKQYHHQQQQNIQNSQKASIYLGQNKETDKLRIDKLLEKTVSFKDVPLMKDLLVIQKKIRSILEDWLAFCRNSLSILEPDMYILPDFPIRHKINRLNEKHSDFDKIVIHRRKSKSVENLTSTNRYNFENELMSRSKKRSALLNKSVDFNLRTHDDKRSKSAFIKILDDVIDYGLDYFQAHLSRKYGMSFKNQTELIAKLKEFKIANGNQHIFPLTLSKHNNKFTKLNVSKSAIWSSSELNKAKALTTSRVLSSIHVPKTLGNLDIEYLNTFVPKSSRLYSTDDLSLLCPVSLHQKLAFDNRYEMTDCKCKKQTVPFVNDLEFDYFLRLVPLEQMIAIAVIDSQNTPHPVQFIFTDLYETNNKIRIQLCKESLRDEFRFLFYDLRMAHEDSGHNLPLLITRHNVGPGMVLIYKNSKLLFCDHIFNGYGYSQQDFLKQLEKCKDDAKQEKYLPNNFHFNHPHGISGRRTAWGGQIIVDNNDSMMFPQHMDSIEDFSQTTIKENLVPKLMVNSIQKKEKTLINLPKINKSSVQV